MSLFFSHIQENRIVGIGGLVVALIGLAFGAYQWLDSKVQPDLSYFASASRTRIVQANMASDLSVTFKGSHIDGDLTAIQIAIWNGGKASIKPTTILQPIAIQIGNGEIPVLEAKVLRTTRAITNVRLDESDGREGRTAIDWQILEQGDGAVIQLIYAGAADAPIAISGAVEGQKTIRQFANQGRQRGLMDLVYVIFLLPMSLWLAFNADGWRVRLVWILAVLFVLVFGGNDIIWYLGFYGTPNPLPIS
jgi:hypothetical protein